MPLQLLDKTIPLSDYIPVDLSVNNPELSHVNLADPDACQAYIDHHLERHGAKVAYGGYLETRKMYEDKPSFTKANSPRNIHLGIDFWAEAETKVVVPLRGVVHSFRNNTTSGDYGPTVILVHFTGEKQFFTLYGHLSLETLSRLSIGREFAGGDVLGTLGTPEINVNYAPHLHFQVIKDIAGYMGDYPGVCSTEELIFYRNNCPDPEIFLRTRV